MVPQLPHGKKWTVKHALEAVYGISEPSKFGLVVDGRIETLPEQEVKERRRGLPYSKDLHTLRTFILFIRTAYVQEIVNPCSVFS
ncbi:MAG: hypothetical protein ACTSUQ_10075 [Candidatus Freyarchaeota archaeon]